MGNPLPVISGSLQALDDLWILAQQHEQCKVYCVPFISYGCPWVENPLKLVRVAIDAELRALVALSQSNVHGLIIACRRSEAEGSHRQSNCQESPAIVT